MSGWTFHYLRFHFSQSENIDNLCVQRYENIFFLVMSIDSICTSIYPKDKKRRKSVEKYKKIPQGCIAYMHLTKPILTQNSLLNHSKNISAELY